MRNTPSDYGWGMGDTHSSEVGGCMRALTAQEPRNPAFQKTLIPPALLHRFPQLPARIRVRHLCPRVANSRQIPGGALG